MAIDPSRDVDTFYTCVIFPGRQKVRATVRPWSHTWETKRCSCPEACVLLPRRLDHNFRFFPYNTGRALFKPANWSLSEIGQNKCAQFFGCLARGARILPSFSGIIDMLVSMTLNNSHRVARLNYTW